MQCRVKRSLRASAQFSMLMFHLVSAIFRLEYDRRPNEWLVGRQHDVRLMQLPLALTPRDY